MSPVVSVLSGGDESARKVYIRPRATLMGALGKWSRVPEPLIFVTELVAFFNAEGFSKLANPKTAIFFLALLPTVVRLEELTVFGFLEIVGAISVGLPLVLGGYVFLAARARRMFKSERAVRTINRSTGAAMACAAVAVATR